MNEAIRIAIEKGGYRKGSYWWPVRTNQGITLKGDDQDEEKLTKEQIVLDSAFWKSLAKALGWEEKITTTSADTGNHWQIKAHEYLDVALDGGDQGKFWKDLIPAPL